jgi:outer membrane protein OmpA-like peptidoglycan-associated protein
MARNRLNPWPSVADLFSALTVTAFASLIFVTIGAVIVDDNKKIEIKAAQELADVFKAKYQAGKDGQIAVHPCADRESEQCIEMQFRFVPSLSDLHADGINQVNEACHVYKDSVERVVQKIKAENLLIDRSSLVLVIEGHTDDRIPPALKGEREQFLYNWKLSSERAASVLYQFDKCGVSQKNGYRITSVGLANSAQLCNNPNADTKCHEQNRRTTLRIRVERHRDKGSHIP